MANELTVPVAPGTIEDNARVMTYSVGGIPSCMKCGEPIPDMPRKYFNFHDACLACSECGGEMAVAYKDGPAEVSCWACARKAQAALEQAEYEARNAAYVAARDMLLDGAGTRAGREAALNVIGDYFRELE